MSKLGYTFYPKDWDSDDEVFELNLQERGLYRELIDRAMLSDNEIIYKPKTWARRFICTCEELEILIKKLCETGVMIIKDGIIKIPSCEKRLANIRNGKKGGRKPNVKPKAKPKSNPTINPNDNQNAKQREIEIESKDKEKEKVEFNSPEFFEKILNEESHIELIQRETKLKPDQIKIFLKKLCLKLVGDRFEMKNEMDVKPIRSISRKWCMTCAEKIKEGFNVQPKQNSKKYPTTKY